MSDLKEQALHIYDEFRKYYGEYHYRKETAGWTAVALHFAFCAALFKATSGSQPTPAGNIIVTAVALVECVFLVSYVQWQFSLKDRGGALFAAAIALHLSLIETTNDTEIAKYLAVAQSDDELYQSPHVLPEMLLKQAGAMNKRGRGAQDSLMWATYALLVLSSCAAIANRWT